jgi:hypothetical protein
LIDTISGLGTVLDADNDFIPDVCAGGAPTTHWVDASAPPGGSGSAANPFQDILSAVNASLTGDTVIVRDGLYTGPANRDANFAGKSLVVKSENGPANCVIDCQSSGRAFRVPGPTTLEARIQGFTIRNGFLGSATTQLEERSGGAIHADQITVWDCVFESCAIQHPFNSPVNGGAIFATRLDARRCTFRANRAGLGLANSSGGAIYLGLISAFGGGSLIQECLFDGNSATYGGAVIAGGQDPLVISHCEFRANSALQGAAAFYALACNARVDNCLFVGNTAKIWGGAIAVNDSQGASITNSTFTANRCTNGFGGAVSFQRNVQGTLANCILWGNSATQGGAQVSLRAPSPSVTIRWSDLEGGQAAVEVLAGTLNWGAGNIALDPQFADPDGADNDPLTYGDNDYSLATSSPCIDAGDNFSLALDFTDIDGDGNFSEPVPLDFALHARRVDVVVVPDTGNGAAPVVDIGAFERP